MCLPIALLDICPREMKTYIQRLFLAMLIIIAKHWDKANFLQYMNGKNGPPMVQSKTQQ